MRKIGIIALLLVTVQSVSAQVSISASTSNGAGGQTVVQTDTIAGQRLWPDFHAVEVEGAMKVRFETADAEHPVGISYYANDFKAGKYVSKVENGVLKLRMQRSKEADSLQVTVRYNTLSAVKVAGKPLSEIIGTAEFPVEEWKQMQQDVTKGGAKIIELRGRSSFQSPSYLSVEMIRSAMGGEAFRWPAGTFVNNEKYKCIMMAMKTTLDVTGCHFEVPTGTADEVASLDASYEHLCKLRDEVISMGIIPPVSEWGGLNPNLK